MTASAHDRSGASGGTRPLSGRRALVTGGGRGVGAAISRVLAAAGAEVAISYVRDEMSAAATVAAAAALGVRCRAYRGSVAVPEDNRAVVEAVAADFGGLDLLISNAGIASRGRTVAGTDAAELEKVLRVHALGPHELCRLALPHLRRRARSDIVFISSVAASRFMPGGAPYAMGKAALEALAHTIAREERAAGVHVNIVAPGLVDTEMGARLVRATTGLDDIRQLDAASPFGHVCTPQEVAEAVVFLVTSGYANDQRITVDGGTF